VKLLLRARCAILAHSEAIPLPIGRGISSLIKCSYPMAAVGEGILPLGLRPAFRRRKLLGRRQWDGGRRPRDPRRQSWRPGSAEDL